VLKNYQEHDDLAAGVPLLSLRSDQLAGPLPNGGLSSFLAPGLATGCARATTGSVAIYRMLQGMAFDDQSVKAMTTAYEAMLVELGLMERSDPLTEIVTSKIIPIFFWPDGRV
jgi:hypothetical protein